MPKNILKNTISSLAGLLSKTSNDKTFFLISDSNRYDRFFLLTQFFKEKLKGDFIITSEIKRGYKTYFPIVIPSYDSLKDEKFIASEEILKIHKSLEIILIFDLSIEAITFKNQTSDLLLTFHNILKKHSFDPKRVILLNSNRNSSKSYDEWANKFSPDFKISVIGYNFYLFEYHIEVITNKWIIDNYNSHLKNLTEIKNKKHFISLNLRPRWHRKALLLFLLSENLLNKGIATYFGESFGNSDGFTIDSPESAAKHILKLREGEKLLSHVENLDKISPITFERDEQNIKKDLWHRKPGEIEFLIPELKISGSFEEPLSYFEIVTETWFSDEKCSFLTEKTIRPILRLNPFILMGSPHGLSYLRSIGFKTFSPFIDESYDEVESQEKRMEMIFKEIKRLCSMSEEEMQNFYHNLAPVLHHNFHHFTNNMAEVFEKEVRDKVLNFLKN